MHQTLGVEQMMVPNVSRFCEHELIWNISQPDQEIRAENLRIPLLVRP